MMRPAFWLFSAVLLLAGCRTGRVVEHSTVATDTAHTVRRDTVRVVQWAQVRDTVRLTERVRQKGDTVWVERWRDRVVRLAARDTVRVVRTDTLWRVREVVRTEKEERRGPRAWPWWGKLLALLPVALIVGILARRL